MATSPQYTGTPRLERVTISIANTNRDGTGSITDVILGATNGTLIDGINVKAQGTTTSGMIRIFHKKASSYILIKEISVSAITPSASVQTFESEFLFDTKPFILLNGEYLSVSTHNAETFNVVITGGDF